MKAWIAGASLLLVTGVCAAKVPTTEAAKLGKELTEVGAERAGNKDGSIPAWIGRDAFSPDMLTLTHAQLEDLRKRLVQDIQQMIVDPTIITDILAQSQAIMDAEPKKADQVIAVVREMMSADPALKADFDKVLAGRGGKSVDGLIAQVQESHLLTIPFIPTVTGVPEIIYDLQSKRYFLTAMTNEDAITDFEVKYEDQYFHPSSLQRKSRGK